MGVEGKYSTCEPARSATYPLFGILRSRGVKIHDSHKPRLLIEDLIAPIQQLIEGGDLRRQRILCEQSTSTHHR
jgi:hypothetical protein